jgi:hypothetical protein
VKYQLVLQWPSSSSTAEYDRLISFEETIRDGLGELGIVDGHDIGSGEMNIFIHTDEPVAAFEKARNLLGSKENPGELKAGYRDFDEDDYVSIYPQGLDHFSVV